MLTPQELSLAYSEAIGVKPLVERVEKIRRFPECDVILADPPCWGYSFFGKRDEGDSRNRLYLQVAPAPGQVEPLCFVFENVLGMVHLYRRKFLACDKSF